MTYSVPGGAVKELGGCFRKDGSWKPREESSVIRCTWAVLWPSPRLEGASAKDLIKPSFPEVHGRGTLLLRSRS